MLCNRQIVAVAPCIVKTQPAEFITRTDVQCGQQESERLAGLAFPHLFLDIFHYLSYLKIGS